MSGAVLSRDEVDEALERLTGELDAVESSLLALDQHPGRRLLEGARLSGATQERWQQVRAHWDLLWQYFDAYRETIRAANQVRQRRGRPGPAELAELTELLTGPSVSFSGITYPVQLRTLTGPERPTEDLTLAETVDRMRGWYTEAADLVAAVDAVWSDLPPRVDLLLAELTRVEALAQAARATDPPAAGWSAPVDQVPEAEDAFPREVLAAIRADLEGLRAAVLRDPLAFWLPRTAPEAANGTVNGAANGAATGARAVTGGFGPVPGERRAAHPREAHGRVDTTRFDQLARAVDEVRGDVQSLLLLREEAEDRLRRVVATVAEANGTLASAQALRAEVLAKIAAADVPALPRPSTFLHERLAAADRLRRAGRWTDLEPLLEDVEREAAWELERARAALAEVRAPLAARAELRGLLQAYRAKAARQGRVEDRELIERYDHARQLLWTAPCDLRAAEAAVMRYQQALARPR
ncbi:hypothetical protein [Allostreptomyces psammosilenae]|uniref:Uncharacterized protein n=1 Tax=Allostreptomyces psammosilenae TaxID=1892865 RepID=A0A853A1W2_9ACTN|nr:hypothetical protein [Allostreptomyces psammosilenae]NYI08369.1 hypothetical protein [Allostreptomyces psammosilenae]